MICYAAKANSSLAILNLFARLGSGFDIVSGGELERVIAAGGDPDKVVFSGVGKRSDEIELALAKGILCFNVESQSELHRISRIAAEAKTTRAHQLAREPRRRPQDPPLYLHGSEAEQVRRAVRGRAAPVPRCPPACPVSQITGVDYHIGSQITEIPPFLDALEKLLGLVAQLRVGRHCAPPPGSGRRAGDPLPRRDPRPSRLPISRRCSNGWRGAPQTILLEPGRALVGNAGVLLTRVEYLKHGAERNFAVVDAAMNDLLRPALYDGVP